MGIPGVLGTHLQHQEAEHGGENPHRWMCVPTTSAAVLHFTHGSFWTLSLAFSELLVIFPLTEKFLSPAINTACQAIAFKSWGIFRPIYPALI